MLKDTMNTPESEKKPQDVAARDVARSARIRKMKFNFLFSMLADHTQFNYMKYYALDHLQNSFLTKCNMFLNLANCEGTEEPTDDSLSGVFDWGYKHFIKRRQLGNLLYVDILSMTSEGCLNTYKFKLDIYELLNLMIPVFEAAFAELFYADSRFKETVEEPIQDAMKLLNTAQEIESELERNQKRFMLLFNTNFIVLNTKRDSMQRMVRLQLETRLMNNHIWDPIEMRYQLNWFKAKVNQTQCKLDNLVGGYQKQIDDYTHQGEYDTKCSHNCMDYLYSTIEELKNLINNFQKKYDNDYEKIENRVTYQRIQIDKLKEQRRFLTEAIGRFHEEIEQMRIYEEKLAIRREEEFQRELEKAAKKKGKEKPGASKGGKGKGKK